MIQTRYGHYIDIRKPDPETIDLRDIAHSLAHTCRFRGFAKHFYSVAQHSYNVSILLDELPVEIQMAGLLHDAAEAYMGDMPTPHKQIFPEVCAVETHLQAAIFDKFGFAWPYDDIVHWADDVMLHVEAGFLMPDPQWARREPTPVGVDLPAWGPEMARRFFLIRFRELAGAMLK